MQIQYRADQHVSEIVASLGRTEDVRFSPSGKRLAVAEFENNRIALFDICHEQTAQKQIGLTGVARISSPYIEHPHGIDFIDEDILIIANRRGHLCIFKVPPFGSNSHEAELVKVISSGDSLLHTPGSVAVVKGKDGLFEALVCNNYAHNVTRHLVDAGEGYSVTRSEILLRDWLQVPDGISVSSDANWIAISNHDTHTVLVYENSPALNEHSDPAGILRSISYPHGLRFTSDGRFILVADAGAPYLHVYGRSGDSWRGVHNPLVSFRVMDDGTFLRRYSTRDGGPKGLDVDSQGGLVVTTCHHQPLAFFDLNLISQGASSGNGRHEVGMPSVDDQALTGYAKRLSDVRQELELHQRLYQAEARAEQAEARAKQAEKLASRAEALQQSSSWRLTAPVRALAVLMGKRGRVPSLQTRLRTRPTVR